MPGTNLTRDQARTRAGVVSDVEYVIELDLTNAPSGAPTFRSVTTITFAATAGASTFADLIAEKVRDVTMNGRSLDPETVYDGARVQLDGLSELSRRAAARRTRSRRTTRPWWPSTTWARWRTRNASGRVPVPQPHHAEMESYGNTVLHVLAHMWFGDLVTMTQ
jgi:aminopeptidase N